MKIGPIPNKTYLEVSQKNPLRWVVLYRENEEEFTCQTGRVKCKDFFNDNLAYFKHGVNFNMYGYDAKLKKNEEGVYFLLLNVGDMNTFIHNINVLNVKLHEQLKCEIAYWQHEKDVVILLPNPLWENTWRMSLATALIRCSNYGYRHEKWEDFFHSQAPLVSMDRVFDELTRNNTEKWGFLVPEDFKGLWYFCGKDYNSKKQPKQTGDTIHNNGCCNWSLFMQQEGVKA